MICGKIDAFPGVWAYSNFCHCWLNKRSKNALQILAILCAWRDFSPSSLPPGWKAILRQVIWVLGQIKCARLLIHENGGDFSLPMSRNCQYVVVFYPCKQAGTLKLSKNP